MNRKWLDYFDVIDKARSRGRVSLGMLSGIVAGAVAGMLFAPKAGKAMREDLKATAEQGLEKVKDAASRLKEYAEEAVEQAKEADAAVEKDGEAVVEEKVGETTAEEEVAEEC